MVAASDIKLYVMLAVYDKQHAGTLATGGKPCNAIGAVLKMRCRHSRRTCRVACRDGGGASAYDRDMADFSHILATRPDFDDEDREWLHHLVADWQVIADLSFADLLLLVQDGDGKYVVAEQCRPSTVMTLRAEDVVGNVMPDDMVGELDAAMLSSVVFRSTVLRTVGKATVCNVYAPVRHNGKTLGLVVRETNMATRESNGRYESESINAGKHLYEMIPRGQFPYKDSVMSQRHIARVADGFIILTMDGVVRYAAPNAISCFRRLGLLTPCLAITSANSAHSY